ncbi:MAG: hypothetical protein A2Y10_12120 [Planctomycetes bacterium GWF2_41_51]|nr:MAG: hypothetical protein A2Y10_12120 [Planctomycetes bacterium GWF2_41_51]HBG28692.1 zinc-binding protein [Phycisphaerales bacterium]
MKKILFFWITVIILLLAMFASVKFGQKSRPDDGKLTVITTLFPLYDFSKNIGGDKVNVSLLLPPGVEPHSFEPKPSDIAKIGGADVFVFTGEFMEPWAHNIIRGTSNAKIGVVDASAEVKMISMEERHECDEHHEHENQDGIDPHIWLDFDNVKIIVDNITNAFCEKDPANADYYKQNADEYKNKINELDNEYRTALANCRTRTIVYGGHYAFGYMAHRYELQYRAAQGLSPDAEPSAQDIIALIEQIRENNIHSIFYEELTNPKIAETIAAETNAKMLALNDAANVSRKDIENNTSFISIMENNLKNFKTGLECN